MYTLYERFAQLLQCGGYDAADESLHALRAQGLRRAGRAAVLHAAFVDEVQNQFGARTLRAS